MINILSVSTQRFWGRPLPDVTADMGDGGGLRVDDLVSLPFFAQRPQLDSGNLMTHVCNALSVGFSKLRSLGSEGLQWVHPRHRYRFLPLRGVVLPTHLTTSVDIRRADQG
jgi:hypothetical protein